MRKIRDKGKIEEIRRDLRENNELDEDSFQIISISVNWNF
jgi:hypothetical protein